MAFGQEDVLFSRRVRGGSRQAVVTGAEPLPAARLVLAVYSGLIAVLAVYVLILLQHQPAGIISAGLLPGVIGILNLLVVLSVCQLVRPAVWFFCLLGLGDVAMALNVWQFLSDVANDTWPSHVNLMLAQLWTGAGGGVPGLLVFSKLLMSALLLKAVLTVWVGCQLQKTTR